MMRSDDVFKPLIKLLKINLDTVYVQYGGSAVVS